MIASRPVMRRLFELVEPIATVSFGTATTEAFRAVGLRNYRDGYFAGRAAPPGQAPAEVVDAVLYSFAAVVEHLRDRGLVDADGGFTDAGRDLRARMESLTDDLAALAYDVLDAGEIDELVAGLDAVAAAL